MQKSQFNFKPSDDSSLSGGLIQKTSHLYRNARITILISLLITSTVFCSGNTLLSDNEFFATLNFSLPGLDSVKSALEMGDTIKAKQRLHTYFMQRTGVNYFDLTTGGNILEADDNLSNYFTVVEIRLFAENEDGSVDWQKTYSQDDEWHWQFHRMDWLINLARVYQKTGNEKYAIGWIKHVLDWARNNPPGYPRTLDTGNRLKNWVESYQYLIHLLKTSSLDSEDHIDILKSLIQQARFLRDNWKSDSNWGASETRGLIEVLVMFPEFNFYPGDSREDWIKLAQNRLLYHLTENFLEDGVQFETSPMYHYLTYRNLLVAYQLMDINNILTPPEFDSLFILPAEYIMHITKPDGYIPQLGDADKTDRHLEYLRIAAEIYNRNDFRFVSSRGTIGQPPIETFKAFPYGKNIIMRSGWGTNQLEMESAKYLVFNYSYNLPWHAHFDMLSIEASANGKNIVIDPGRFTYDTEDGWRDYFKNTSAHNTIVVNNLNQVGYVSASAEWVSLPEFDYINAWHDAYTYRQQKVRHRRKVFFINTNYWVISDVITGTGSHSLDLFFHLDPEYKLNHTFNSVSQSFSTPDFSIIPSNTNAEATLDTGWVSFEYGTKLEAPVLKYSKTGTLPKTFETVLYPLALNNTLVQVNTLESFDSYGNILNSDQAVALKLTTQDGKDILGINHSMQERINVHSYSYSGEAIFIKANYEENISQYALVKGTSLESNGTTLVDTGKDSVSISFKDLTVSVEGELVTGFKAWAPDVVNVFVNGKSVSFKFLDNYVYYGIIPTSNYSSKISIHKKDYLDQIYPNPALSITTLKFYLHKGTHANITIYDNTGKKLQTLLNKTLEEGKHNIEFNVSSISPGIYFCKLETVFGVDVTKISVISR